MTRWTRDSIRQQLRAVGRYCTMVEWTEQGRAPSTGLIVGTYGSWRAAWADVGYEPQDRRTKILEQFRNAGRYWTAAEWDRAGRTPHSRTVRRYWANWDAAWAEAGFAPVAPIEWTTLPRWRVLRPELQALWLARRAGASLTQLAAHYAMSREGIRYRLHQIERILQGHDPHARPRLYSMTTIIDMLQRWHQQTGHWPTRHAWTDAHQQPSAATIVRYFGSWRTALEMAALRIDTPSTAYVQALTVAEAARKWHVSPSTVHRLIQLKAISAQQLGRQWIILTRDPKEPVKLARTESS